MSTPPLLLALLLMQLVLRSDGAPQLGGTNNPRWYVLMGEDDFPAEHSNHSIVKANVKEYNHVAQHGHECLGMINEHTYPDYFMSWDLQWSCLVAMRFIQSPHRTYKFEEADFVVVPAPMPADLADDSVDLSYFKDAEFIFPRRKEKPHLLLMRWGLPKQVKVIEKAPEVAADFWFMVQQYPAYFFFEFKSWYGKGAWHHKPKEHPALNALKYHIVGAPWMGMMKFTQGSKYFHTPLDVKQLRATKKQPLKGFYQVRTPQRRWLHKICNSMADGFCISENINEFNMTDKRRFQYVKAYDTAWVAMQPQGDEPTRTSQNDMWAHDVANLFLAEPEWIIPFFPFTDVIDYRRLAYYTRHIDGAIAENDEHYLEDFRKQFSVDRTVEMITEAHNISRVLQYMQNPHEAAIRWDALEEMYHFDDAFTFSVKALLRQMCNAGRVPDRRKCGGGRKFRPLHDGVVGFQHRDLGGDFPTQGSAGGSNDSLLSRAVIG